MTKLSRREFLRRSGLIGVGLGTSFSSPQLTEFAGRPFGLVSVHAQPDPQSLVVRTLQPDSVHRFNEASAGWYRLDDGFVQRDTIQPIIPYERPTLPERPGFWAEQIAPSSTVRRWCTGDASVVTVLGFGAVVYVADRLTDRYGQVWYALAADPNTEPAGWAPALHYARWIGPRQQAQSKIMIGIDRPHMQLLVYDRSHVIAQLPVYASALPATPTTVTAVQPGMALDADRPLGIPWLMQLGSGERLHGAFWHNRFGTTGSSASIELPTFSARWLYELLAGSPQAL